MVYQFDYDVPASNVTPLLISADVQKCSLVKDHQEVTRLRVYSLASSSARLYLGLWNGKIQ